MELQPITPIGKTVDNNLIYERWDRDCLVDGKAIDKEVQTTCVFYARQGWYAEEEWRRMKKNEEWMTHKQHTNGEMIGWTKDNTHRFTHQDTINK